MELSTFAYTFGIIELLICIPLLFYSRQTMKWIDKAFKDDVQLRFFGVIMTVLGALILLDGYEVSLDPVGLVQLVAWLVMLKGLMYTWWPQTAARMKKKYLKSEAFVTFGGLAGCVVGLLLLYAGSIL